MLKINFLAEVGATDLEKGHDTGHKDKTLQVPILQASSTAVLPLSFRGQTLSSPRAVGNSIIPGDVEDRVVKPGTQQRQSEEGHKQ